MKSLKGHSTTNHMNEITKSSGRLTETPQALKCVFKINKVKKEKKREEKVRVRKAYISASGRGNITSTL